MENFIMMPFRFSNQVLHFYFEGKALILQAETN